jgi:hypothetical protein
VLACIALMAALRASGNGNDGGHDDEPGHGGSDRNPRRPLTPPGAGDPSWWPQFERDLAEYTDSQRDGAPLA